MAKAKSKKECVYMPGMSEALKKGKVPLSPAVKANGFVFVSGLPPLDCKTGKLISGELVNNNCGAFELRLESGVLPQPISD